MPISTRSCATDRQGYHAPHAEPRARRRGDQGHRHAPPDRREHGGVEAPHPAFHLCRRDRRHRAGGRCAPTSTTIAAARPKLTMLPLLIVAICRALPEFPMINARYDDEARRGDASRPRSISAWRRRPMPGLTVPVIRDAQDKNVWQLATEIAPPRRGRARGQAQARRVSGGGTITVTSLGPLGGIATTPVINRPEVAIIGPNKIVERPVFRRRRDRARQADEPVDQLRPSRRRRLGCGELRPGAQEISRDAGAAVRGLSAAIPTHLCDKAA